MPKYRVSVRTTVVETVEAANPYMAAAAVGARRREGVEITDVRPAVGRSPATKRATRKAANKQPTKKTAKKSVKATKKRRLSPQARAKLAQNLVKARAARAAKAKAAKKRTKRKASKKRA
jgi:hypothetical protein